MNQITLLGRVGGEPQKRGSLEHPVVIFSLATHTHYKYESGMMFYPISYIEKDFSLIFFFLKVKLHRKLIGTE